MVRLSIIALITALASCQAGVPPQTEEQKRLSTLVYEQIMQRLPDYVAFTSTKVLAACITWPDDQGRKLALSGASSYITGQTSDVAIRPSQLAAAALEACKPAESEPGAECQCQMIDRNGSNVLYVQ